jgi:hypothetical protein
LDGQYSLRTLRMQSTFLSGQLSKIPARKKRK